MKAIYARELKSCFLTVTGWLFSAFLLLFCGIFVMAYNFGYGYPSFTYVLQAMTFVFLAAVPLLTMRSFAGERRQGADRLLYAAPVKSSTVAAGKYLALLTVFLAPLCVMALYPPILSLYGFTAFGAAYGALVGFFFLGAALLAVGLFLSSLTDSPAAAAGLCFAMLLLDYFLGGLADFASASALASAAVCAAAAGLCALIVWRMTRHRVSSLLTLLVLLAATCLTFAFAPRALSGLVPKAMDALALFSQYQAFAEGIFDVVALVRYAATAAVFLFFTVQSLEKRRWIG